MESGVSNRPDRRTILWGLALLSGGTLGAALGYVPPSPRAGGEPLTGWAARLFATGLALFGGALVIAGCGRLRALAATLLAAALACWLGWLIVLYSR